MPLMRSRILSVYFGRLVRFSGVSWPLAGVIAHLLCEALGVVGADLEGDDRADVAEDGVRSLVIQLRQILVGDDQG